MVMTRMTAAFGLAVAAAALAGPAAAQDSGDCAKLQARGVNGLCLATGQVQQRLGPNRYRIYTWAGNGYTFELRGKPVAQNGEAELDSADAQPGDGSEDPQ